MVKAGGAFWRGRRVLVTGHTGFKGVWLTLWLARLGAAVTGVSLPPEKDPRPFANALRSRECSSVFADIRHFEEVRACFADARPEIVFHLAAQSLVRRSYRDPVGTY